MKRLMAIVLSAGLLVGVMMSPVYAWAAGADNATPGSSASASPVAEAGVFKGYHKQLQAWRAQAGDLWTQLRDQRKENRGARQTIRTSLQTLKAQVQDARKNKDTAKLDQIKPIRTQIRSLTSANKQTRLQNKDLWKQFAAAVKAGDFAAANQAIQGLVGNLTTIKGNLSQIGQQLQQAIPIFQ